MVEIRREWKNSGRRIIGWAFMGARIGSIAAWTRQQDAVGIAGEGERSQRRRCQAVDVGALSLMGAEGFVEAVEAAQILLVMMLD